MNKVLRETVIRCIAAVKGKRVNLDVIVGKVRQQTAGSISYFEMQKRLLAVLKDLESEELLVLPKSKKCWDRQSQLPDYVTAVRKEEEEARAKRKAVISSMQNQTAWEPKRMAAFAHKLKSIAELESAAKVNAYLLNRPADAVLIPHRERALRIFADEKALDNNTRNGLFNGLITLTDLDCFYCPEPLPFHALSMDSVEIAGKPLLVVENANTYWSCCRANSVVRRYAAVIYGQGFKVMANAAARANDGLLDIENQLHSKGVAYFGDLDPTGIAIPTRINECREANSLPLLYAEYSLYQVLLEIDRSVDYGKSQLQDHDPKRARQWLGDELADIYLAQVHQKRWPQEGMSMFDIVAALKQSGVS
ncbi:MAG: hypothetical protein ACI8ZB_002694 [Desulforhopalus sp.]|jgi:hypothetical protein